MMVEAKLSFPKISVVTPNYNQAEFIELTIQSVLNQKYPNLEYIIIDGGSTDGSVEIIKKYESKLHYWVSEPDNGMYDAINKGFAKASGEIMCWINSDDVLWENSLHFVANAFIKNKQLQWLQGFPSVINEQGTLIYQREPVFSKFYFYLFEHKNSFSFIQQESTFWTKDLWKKAGGYLSVDYKLASDFDLWMRFYKYSDLHCTNTQLGAFRIREGQKSSNKDAYLNETEKALKTNFVTLNYRDKFIIKMILLLKKVEGRVKSKLIRKFNNNLKSFIIGKPKMINLK